MKIEGFMSHSDFKKMVDDLVIDYKTWIETEKDIRKFLSIRFTTADSIMKINPLSIITELSKCKGDGVISYCDAKVGIGFTDRFIVLMGICEMIESFIHPKPKFKYRDIVQDKIHGVAYVVMDFARDKDEDEIIYDYWLDDHNGKTVIYRQSYIENNFKKIGEVTDDVMEKANPNLKKC